jgi:hypothetical protein
MEYDSTFFYLPVAFRSWLVGQQQDDSARGEMVATWCAKRRSLLTSRRRASDAGGEVSVDYRLLVVINTLLPPLLATTSYYYTPVNGILETQAVSSYLTSYRTSSKPHGKAREKEQTRSVEHIRQFETGLIEDQHYIQGFSLAHTTSATN